MQFSDIAELIAVTETVDDVGDLVKSETPRQVFVSVRSVGQREAYEAAAVGLKPKITLILANKADYEEEQRVRYDGKEYRIIRTYFKDNSERMELICEAIVNEGGIAHANAAKCHKD